MTLDKLKIKIVCTKTKHWIFTSPISPISD